MKKLYLIFMLVLTLTLIIACASAPAFQFTPGIYTGSAMGYGGMLNLQVEVSNNRITTITIGENRETTGLAIPAFNRVPAQIIERQSLNVDTVTGVTITSIAIIEAVREALLSAGATEEQLR